mmetsp:Transcript_20081/g.42867  ORF Transcript_20081/g.42867 Transcript_20081/m.42867 type:complete len:147 (-) Transcript_20081:3-443(-)
MVYGPQGRAEVCPQRLIGPTRTRRRRRGLHRGDGQPRSRQGLGDCSAAPWRRPRCAAPQLTQLVVATTPGIGNEATMGQVPGLHAGRGSRTGHAESARDTCEFKPHCNAGPPQGRGQKADEGWTHAFYYEASSWKELQYAPLTEMA